MTICWGCNTPITSENESSEHILLNSIGGRLKSKSLLCKECNGNFGDGIDTELSTQLNFLSNMLNIDRDRGEPQPIKFVDSKTGEKYVLEPGGKPLAAAPKFKREETNEGTIIHFEARSDDEADSFIKNICRKHKELDIDEIAKSKVIERERLKNPLQTEIVVGSNKAFRAICKIAINFYLHEGGSLANISHLIPFIKGEIAIDCVGHYYPEEQVITAQPDDILHTIIIRGNNASKVLYAYIEFFSTYQFIILLNSAYEDQDVEFNYSFDVIGCSVVETSANLRLTREGLISHLASNEDPTPGMMKRLNKTMTIVKKKQNNEHSKELTERAMGESFEKYPVETIITKDMLNDFIRELIDNLAPSINRHYTDEIE